MNFAHGEKELAFAAEVEQFLDEYLSDPVRRAAVSDRHPEQLSQTVDSAAKREFIAALAERGWLGMSWPVECGGTALSGIYDFMLTEALARRGLPQPGKGVGMVGKTIIRNGSAELKERFLPRIIRGEIEFAVGYSEPEAGSDAANMQLKAERDGDWWVMNGQKIWTTSAHFADWYWFGARTDPDASKHNGISLFLAPMRSEGMQILSTPTIGKDTTNEVFFDNVRVHNDYMVGEPGKGFQYISEALDLERFTMFTFSPIEERTRLLCNWVRNTQRDGRALRDDPVVRSTIANTVTETEVARCLGYKFVAASLKGGKPPTCEASEYKLYGTTLSQRVANTALDVIGGEAQLKEGTDSAPLRSRFEGTYRCTVVETIGGGASEIQKNIIARRKLGLPRNF